MKLPAGEVVLGLVFAGSGIFWSVSAAGLQMWDGFAPGTGFLPFAYGLLLAALGIAATLADAVPAGEAGEGDAKGPLGRPLLVLLALAAGVAGIESAGFFASMFLAMLFLFRVVERLPLLSSLAVSGVSALVLTVVFRTWLGVPFPAGPWGF